jgi:SAM-dependent methyltransferase
MASSSPVGSVRKLRSLLITNPSRSPAGTLLLDRRQRHLCEATRAGGLTLGPVWTLTSRIDGVPIYAALLRPPEGKMEGTAAFSFPKRIDVGEISYLRFVDRFYLPALPDPTISAALFDLIASIYDRLTSPEVNIETARLLLQAVLDDCSVKAPRILDFGCGTGLAIEAARRLDAHSNRFELIGTDVSENMLEIAVRRGEHALLLDEWRGLPDNSFEGAISAFVLHFGVSGADRLRIARQLRPGARFAANYFKANQQAVEVLVSDLADLGLVFERMEPLATTPHSENPMLVFTKGARAC